MPRNGARSSASRAMYPRPERRNLTATTMFSVGSLS